MMRQDGKGPNNGQHMYQNCQKPNDASRWYGRNNGQYMNQNGQMPPQSQPSQG